MNRRDLLKYLLTAPIAATVDIEKLLWEPAKTIFLPSLEEILFDWKTTPLIFGIPYHEFNATTGTWLGLTRVNKQQLD